MDKGSARGYGAIGGGTDFVDRAYAIGVGRACFEARVVEERHLARHRSPPEKARPVLPLDLKGRFVEALIAPG